MQEMQDIQDLHDQQMQAQQMLAHAVAVGNVLPHLGPLKEERDMHHDLVEAQNLVLMNPMKHESENSNSTWSRIKKTIISNK